MLNSDYRDMLHALVDEKVSFLLVGVFPKVYGVVTAGSVGTTAGRISTALVPT
jgi:hypothetical protein